ncbi:MAG: hypothetical protein GX958_12355 [Desulfitobacterium sp.]|nr:hypothetical protein [Desulfitobacterium sp.]
MFTFSGTAFAAEERNVQPAIQTTEITSTQSASLNVPAAPMALTRPTTGTYLPYNGYFIGVWTEIFSNYYFLTSGSTEFYIDWNVTSDTPDYALWHFNVYNASTNKLVLSSQQFNTGVHTGKWTSRVYNLDPAYNYYISFVNDTAPLGGPRISGDFTVRN